ncbi:MAG: metalloregulator ArsR/SmtB family transcription factor [Phenylobacterium sp.]|uniref:ArsR/SmtB family transcription factor n=1 Tax=Phenylobacterium sp. TaxID=1871053 RepID=UPI00271B83F1|nr:metalloregulator ArsR/SmtB family transcription factor [Phenylobacterium sp.]MDO8910579.1 metalloregulator ArsR/SmtB family transcription factor [Phenylobacterium sp.]MDP3102761.1 metalloregulator ArsR/SmtB family transcription factor [Phenylobacterium sp.]HQT53805.1 metalloregulator ArsR/SmtB family transcription factor [Phenylobacterium sp.]
MRMFYIKQMNAALAVRPSSELSELADSAQSAARLLKLLASEQRLLLLCRLVEGEASVGVLAEHAKLAQSAASQHLAKMRAEGLVATRRQAQTIYYRLDDPAAVRVLDALCEIYRGQAAGAQ